MKLTSLGLTAALLTTLAAVPALAQQRDPKRREAARAEQSAQRPAAQQREAARSAEQSQRVEQARSEQARPRRAEAPRVQAPTVQTPAVQAPVIAPRAETRRNEVVGRAVPRTGPPYVEREHRNDHAYAGAPPAYAPRVYAPHVYAPRVYAPRVYAPHAYMVRPYVFRPHLSIGFGIFAGYPAPYAWSYSAPVYVYGYRAPRAPVYITPGMPAYGGIALEISPYDADVYIDGNYAGRVHDFDGTEQPLTVVAGTHRVEVQAPGYAPLVFDVVVEGGQVVPYRGDLQPL